MRISMGGIDLAYIITLTNQKGGVGKTTSSAALISGLTAQGNHVLGVDLDPQGNLGFSLGIEIEQSATLYDALKNHTPIEEIIQHTPSGDIIPSNILLSSAELEFKQKGREFLLKELLAPLVDNYDYIVIDTPPALNILTVNAYVASQALIIPMIPDILSLLGVSQLKETVESVQTSFNTNLNVIGILLTKFDARLNLSKEVLEMAETMANLLNTKVFETKIRNSVSVAEAPAHGESILQYAPHSKPAQDYESFTNEVIQALKVI